MDLRSKELREKLLQDTPLKRPEPAIINPEGSSRLGLLLAVVALAVSLVVVYLVVQVNGQLKSQSDQLRTEIGELRSVVESLGPRIEDTKSQLGSLSEGLQTVESKVGVTQTDVQKARSYAEGIRREQQKEVETLNSQIQTKADVMAVAALDEKSGTKFREIDGEIIEVREEAQATRQDLEQAVQELNTLGIKVSDQGSLIAVNQTGINELRLRGERDYLQFDAKKKQRMKVGEIVVELRKADQKKSRVDLKLYYDDKEVERKGLYTNTPIVFYVGRNRVQHELVINEVRKDQAIGYVSVPKVKTSPSS